MADSQHSAVSKKENRWRKYIDWEQCLWMLMLSSKEGVDQRTTENCTDLFLKIILQNSFNQMYFWEVWLSVKRLNESLCISYGSLKIYATYAPDFWKWLCTSTDFLGKPHGFIICWVRWGAEMRFVISTSDTGLVSFYALLSSLVWSYRVAVPNIWLVKDVLASKLVKQLKPTAIWNTKTKAEDGSVQPDVCRVCCLLHVVACTAASVGGSLCKDA